MSIKVRITAWITLMVLLLAAMTLVFVLVINHNAITDDPAGRLVNVVQENVKDVEFDRGKFEWDDLSMYSGGVYSQFYSTASARRAAGGFRSGPGVFPKHRAHSQQRRQELLRL